MTGGQREDLARVTREIRAGLDHPVIDADGHTIECWPLLDEYCRDEGITGGVADVRAARRLSFRVTWPAADPADPARATRSPWWIFPAGSTEDFATASIPGLMYERLEEIGIDYAVVYPTEGLTFAHVPDEDIRRRACRALNRYHHDAFSRYGDRMTVPAAIPMHSPAEALDEIEFATRVLGFRTLLIPSYVERATPPRGPYDMPYWLDTYGTDSAYDYDPVWASCVRSGLAVSTHSSGMSIGTRCSPTNYMYNHIGHFASIGEAICKSLFMGGVTDRFPDLRISLLEGGVGSALSLLTDLCGHWEKRNPDRIGIYDPANLDRARFDELFEKHASPDAVRAVARIAGSAGLTGRTQDPIDDWARCAITSADDIVAAFNRNFFFGCEADDPMAAVALSGSAGLPRLNAMFSSDIGHWDVPVMARVLHEAHEPVAAGVMSPSDFAAFTFGHVARFYLDGNPDFFVGTTVADAASRLLSTGIPTGAPPLNDL